MIKQNSSCDWGYWKSWFRIVKALVRDGYKVDETWTSDKHPDATLALSYKNCYLKSMAVYAAGLI